jgi:diphthine-ammonia ligase
MCGILSFFGTWKTDDIVIAFKKVAYRGQDGFGFVSDSEPEGFYCNNQETFIAKLKESEEHSNIMLHNLHALVGHCPQPVTNDTRAMIFNGEIYNWRMLNEMYHACGQNDTEVLFNVLQYQSEENMQRCLDELDGVYALVYANSKQVVFTRDLVGVKPLFYNNSTGKLVVASEKKCLRAIGLEPLEVNPRHIFTYNKKSKELAIKTKPFFTHEPTHTTDLQAIKDKVEHLLESALQKRLPQQKFGILFSGGIDSTLLAFLCKKLGKDFVCYTAVLEEEGMEPAQDLVWAKRVAQALDVPLKIITLSMKEVPAKIKKIVPLIESTNVVKVGVALPFFIAAEQAKKDGVRVLFSGLGSEEIFGGYERHAKAQSLNKECLFGLKKMYERDLYRDDIVTMANTMELRLPFLDKDLIEYCIKIPEEHKIKDINGVSVKKYILRVVAEQVGLQKEFAFRKKQAAQYGSKFDRALGKLAKQEGKNKSQYLAQFLPHLNKKLAVLFSGGKDSCYASHIMQQQNYDIACLVTLKSANEDSFMFHTPNIHLVEKQAEALGIPLIEQETQGKKEHELGDMRTALEKAKKEYDVQGVVTGALFSNYQRDRIERVCDELGLMIFSPLWHKDQEMEMREIIAKGFSFIITKIAAEGLTEEWLGKEINEEALAKLVVLREKNGLNVAGEGGEFETLMINGPCFKERIKIIKGKKVMENECTGVYVIEGIEIKEKILEKRE